MRTYYAIQFTKPGAKVSRFALYYIKDGKLEVEWPYGKDISDRNLLPCQVYYKDPQDKNKYPAYHFKVGNVGYNKLRYMEEALKEHFKQPVEIFVISGWSPSSR